MNLQELQYISIFAGGIAVIASLFVLYVVLLLRKSEAELQMVSNELIAKTKTCNRQHHAMENMVADIYALVDGKKTEVVKERWRQSRIYNAISPSENALSKAGVKTVQDYINA